VNGQAGFNRDFNPSGIDLEVPVEAEIAHQNQAQVSIARCDLLEARGRHDQIEHRPRGKTESEFILLTTAAEFLRAAAPAHYPWEMMASQGLAASASLQVCFVLTLLT
jgi:hypothetical protein